MMVSAAMPPPRVFDLIIFGQRDTFVLDARMGLLCDSIHRGFISIASWELRTAAGVLNFSTCPKYSVAECDPDVRTRQAPRGGALAKLRIYEEQFECLRYNFKRFARRSDLGIVAEHDEIPFPSLLIDPTYETRGLVTNLFYYYHAGCLSTKPWDMGAIATGADIHDFKRPFHLLREWARKRGAVYRNQSWHFSTFFGPEDVVRKNAGASLHPECNRYPYTSVAWQREAQRKCVQFCGGEGLRKTPPNLRDALPPLLQAVPADYAPPRSKTSGASSSTSSASASGAARLGLPTEHHAVDHAVDHAGGADLIHQPGGPSEEGEQIAEPCGLRLVRRMAYRSACLAGATFGCEPGRGVKLGGAKSRGETGGASSGSGGLGGGLVRGVVKGGPRIWVANGCRGYFEFVNASERLRIGQRQGGAQAKEAGATAAAEAELLLIKGRSGYRSAYRTAATFYVDGRSVTPFYEHVGERMSAWPHACTEAPAHRSTRLPPRSICVPSVQSETARRSRKHVESQVESQVESAVRIALVMVFATPHLVKLAQHRWMNTSRFMAVGNADDAAHHIAFAPSQRQMHGMSCGTSNPNPNPSPNPSPNPNPNPNPSPNPNPNANHNPGISCGTSYPNPSPDPDPNPSPSPNPNPNPGISYGTSSNHDGDNRPLQAIRMANRTLRPFEWCGSLIARS